MTRIEQIEARLAAATPGPWTLRHDGWTIRDSRGNRQIAHTYGRDGSLVEQQVNDADFIAHAPDDIRYLLDKVKRLREALKVFADMACDKDEDDLCSLETSDNTGDVYDAGCFRTQNYVADLARKQLEAE